MKMVIVGCGYVGSRLASELVGLGHSVTATTRTTTIKRPVFDAFQLDFDDAPKGAQVNCEGSVVYYLVPPPRGGAVDTRLDKFLNQILCGSPAKFVLISTTGVYGDCQGAWVDESALLNPSTDQAKARVDAERICTSWALLNDIDLVILRVPAIYGPGRAPVKRIRQGLTLPPEEQCGFSNRIHVDDLVQVCRLAGEVEVMGVFNVSDGVPLRMSKYFRIVAEIWNLPEPQLSKSATESLSDRMVAYLRDSRKIDNSRMLAELGLSLQYGDVRKGLQMCLEAESTTLC